MKMNSIIAATVAAAALAFAAVPAVAAGHSYNQWSGSQSSSGTYKGFNFGGNAGAVGGLYAPGGNVYSTSRTTTSTAGGGSANPNQVNAWEKSGASGNGTVTVASPNNGAAYVTGSMVNNAGGGAIQYGTERQGTSWSGHRTTWH